MEVLKSGPIVGFEKHHTTGKVTRKVLSYEIRNTKNWEGKPHLEFWLVGGPTGFESFVLQDEKRALDPDRWEKGGYWCACFGTKGRYNELRIHHEEMNRVLREFIEQGDPS